MPFKSVTFACKLVEKVPSAFERWRRSAPFIEPDATPNLFERKLFFASSSLAFSTHDTHSYTDAGPCPSSL